MKSTLSASEALYGFCGWLTSRDKKTAMSSTDNAAPIADLIKRFCDVNQLSEPREHWTRNLTHPAYIPEADLADPVKQLISEQTALERGASVLRSLGHLEEAAALLKEG